MMVHLHSLRLPSVGTSFLNTPEGGLDTADLLLGIHKFLLPETQSFVFLLLRPPEIGFFADTFGYIETERIIVASSRNAIPDMFG